MKLFNLFEKYILVPLIVHIVDPLTIKLLAIVDCICWTPFSSMAMMSKLEEIETTRQRTEKISESLNKIIEKYHELHDSHEDLRAKNELLQIEIKRLRQRTRPSFDMSKIAKKISHYRINFIKTRRK